MKKSPLPKLYLIIADTLLLLAVLAIAYPNIVLMETMSSASVALCCVLVLAGMAMMLAPYVFEYLNEKQSISNDAKKTKKDIDLIFENLAALQLMIAETKEMGEQIEEKLSFQLAKDTDIKFETFKNGIETLRENIKQKIREIKEDISELHSSVSDATAQIETDSIKIDEFSEKLASLKNDVEELEQTRAQITQEPETTPKKIEIPITNIEDDLEEIPEDLTNEEENTNFEEIENIEDETEVPQELTYEIDKTFEEENNTGTAEDSNFIQESEQNEEENPEQNKLSGLMSKALGNAMSVAPSIEKIISSAKFAQESKPEQISETPIENLSKSDVEGVEENIQENVIELDENFEDPPQIGEIKNDSENISANDILNDIDFDAEENEPLPQVQDFEIDNSQQPSETAENLEEKIDTFDDLLFDDLPENKKIKPTKKDTTVTLKALIGIGNKPYLRGNNSFLNANKGLAMDYVEIGVWRAIIPPFEGNLNFSIWINDEQQIGENSYSIELGQKQEITL